MLESYNMNESREKLSGRELLQDLEATHEYVFHGSDEVDLDYLEPRQAYNYSNGEKKPDGDPAVFASSKADYAIMMALINKNNCPKGFRSSASSKQKENGEIFLRLRATKSSADQLNSASFGYVYVFDKNLFRNRGGGVEYVSSVGVSPIKKVKVIKTDLPPCIEFF